MSSPTATREVIHTRIWEEVAEPDNPFAAAACYCHGYDVYGDILLNGTWIDYLYLLFTGERPTAEQRSLLERLAIALANAGPRDPAVRAAMNGGIGGSQNAACLMAALGVGAGQYGGAHEVALAIDNWEKCGRDMSRWQERLGDTSVAEVADAWLPIEHPAGFDPHGASCATPIRQTLDGLAASGTETLAWLRQHREDMENIVNMPLAMTGVAAAAMVDLGLNSMQGEMLYLILRLPGAAVHSLEQREYGWRKYPFFGAALKLSDDPGPVQTSRAEQ